MTIKKNNLLLMALALMGVAMYVFLGAFIPSTWGINYFFEYFVVLGIGLLFLKKDGLKLTDALPYSVPGKAFTYVVAVAMAFLIQPLSVTLSEIGAIIGGDALSEALNGNSVYAKMSMPEFLFTMALIPAVFEEMFFRGFFYDGFKRAGGIRLSILFTAVLFGLFHMNLQQIIYASALGVFIAVLRELSGSMWPGMLFHFINNAWSCLETRAPKESVLFKLPIEQLSLRTDAGHTVYTLVRMVVCTAALIWLLGVLAKKCGRLEEYKSFFKPASEVTAEKSKELSEANKTRVVTVPLIIGVLIYIMVAIIMLIA